VAILTVRTYPDEVLHENCEEVTAITPEIEQLIDDMFETMFKNKGVGLAAPQVGVLKNIIIAAPQGTDKETYVYINPVITKSSGEVTDVEGCLSIPCASAEVTRAQKIWVTALDRNGKMLEFSTKDFHARIIQHEADHLKGTLFIDHLGFDARKEVIDCARNVNRL